MRTDLETCHRAVRSKDARFDGWFFTAVRTTGIYCRPSCPATTPKRENLTFYPSAAAAQANGYRACKRCRPDASPGSPEWNVRADVVARAMRLIGDGVVDREGVAGLAARLGYSVRQLERALRAELGAGPIALARAQRAQTARTLIETTALPLADVAFAAGFGSIRSFNDTVRTVFAAAPNQLRSGSRVITGNPGYWQRLDLRLAYRAPFHPGVLAHLVATAIPGIEEWVGDDDLGLAGYACSMRLPHGPGVARLASADGHIAARVWLNDLRDLTTMINRCRFLLDLDADPEAVDATLAADPRLAPLITADPGQRVLHAVDGGELAVRMVLGQQISTRAARTHGARLVQAFGEPMLEPVGGLTHLFPLPAALAAADPGTLLAMPASRRATVSALASALDGGLDLSPGADWAAARTALTCIRGIGPWTVEGVAMRALGDPDAFLGSDLGIRRAMASLGIADVDAAAQAWRPWRAYAAQYLWSTLDHDINRLEGIS